MVTTINNNTVLYIWVVRRVDPNLITTENVIMWKYGVYNLIVVIISQYRSVSNNHIIYFEPTYIMCQKISQ